MKQLAFERVGVFAAVLFAVAGVASAAEESVYKSWTDWGWRPTEKAGTNASDNCRYYADLSVPLHGPWLTNPTATGMTVTWMTRAACGAAVEWREKGTRAFTRRWIARQGAVDYLSNIHTLHLTGLKPGTTYEYRLVASMANSDYYSHEPFVWDEVHSFTTMNPEAPACKAFFTSDVHGSCRLCLAPMLERGHARDAELIFYLGDNVDDGVYNDCEYWMTFCFLDDSSHLFAKDRPLVAIRGNHDCSGRVASRWGDLLPRPDGKAYYTVRQGPVLYVLLDIFEENQRGSTTAGKEQFADYRREMADWLRAQKATDDWKGATYRVVLCHYGVVDDFHCAWPRETFGEILRDTTPEGRVHLYLCGHMHRHLRKDPGSSAFATLRQNGRPYVARKPRIDKKTGKPIPQPVYTNRFSFAEIELDRNDAVTIEATREKLQFRAWAWRTPGERVACYDALDIAPDGTVVR